MGLFSSKKKHYVDTSVVRVVDDIMVPNVGVTAIIESIIQDRDLTQSLQNQAMNGTFRNFERMYRYAERGDYFYGLPDARVLSSSDGFPLAKAAIESEVGQPVTLDYIHFRPLNNTHAAWQFLTHSWGYDPDTNTIGALNAEFPEITFYLKKIVAVMQTEAGLEPEQSSLGIFGDSSQAGLTPERPAQALGTDLGVLRVEQEVRSGPGEVESAEIHYTWIDGDGVVNDGIEILDLTSYDGDQEYYQARYRYTVGEVEHLGYWTYDPATGPHTELNAVFAPPTFVDPGTYFPFAVFRREKENRAAPGLEETEEYQTTEKLLKYIGMDFQEISDTIHENEDIADIEQAVLLLAVPMTTEDPIQIDYLYRYFLGLIDRLPPQGSVVGVPLRGLTAAPDESYAVEISDADFRMTMSFDKVTRRYRAGSIGPVGSFENVVYTETPGTQLLIPGFSFGGAATRKTRAIRKQITSAVYEEILVANPVARYDIYRGKSVEGGHDDERMLVPLDYNIAREMSVIDREDLYYRSLNFVFNSRVTVKTKWYESGVFKALLVIVAVVITIVSFGADGGTTLWAALAAGGAAATAAIVALIKTIIFSILESIIYKFLFTLVVEQIGVEAGFLLAIAAVAYGGYAALKDGKIVMGSTATNMLKVASGLTAGAQETLKGMFSEYQDDLDAFKLMAEEKWEELEAAKDLLDTKNFLDPFAFIGLEPLVLFGESPEDYYKRTNDTPNPGILSLDIVQNYVSNSLRLPSIEESLGEYSYV